MNRLSAETTTRIDLQALRGLEVLLVVFYHARLGRPVAGYLGVDILFVISDFLITSQVRKSIERDDFSFTQFYFRCAKRLSPAAYDTFPVTVFCAPFILGSEEQYDFLLPASLVLIRDGTGSAPPPRSDCSVLPLYIIGGYC